MSRHSYHLFTGPEDELLVQLQKVEPVLRLTCLGVDGLQKLANDFDDLRQRSLVGVVLGSMLEHGFQQERIPRQTRCRLRQVAVQLQLS